ncbi:MAG: helix-turn-helix domain-containing protein [Chitinophagales bacterium]|nr:helix-turn-helix domain-containing protein [Chitinophagales bacterium]
MEKLVNYFRTTLPVDEFNALAVNLGITPNKWGRLMNGSTTPKIDEIKKIANYLKTTPSELIQQYDIDIDTIPIGAVREMLKDEGMRIEFATHVA